MAPALFKSLRGNVISTPGLLPARKSRVHTNRAFRQRGHGSFTANFLRRSCHRCVSAFMQVVAIHREGT